MKGYCNKCRKKIEIESPRKKFLKDGRKSWQGRCPFCSSKVVKIVSSTGREKNKNREFLAENNFIEKIASILVRKKAENVVLLDLREVNSYLCDFFLICTAKNDNHVKVLVEKVEEFIESKDIKIHHREEDKDFQWTLLDLGYIILHIFQEEARTFYDLERLWNQARKTSYN